MTYAQWKDAPLAHQQLIVASFEMANEFTIVLAGSLILLITVNYEKNSRITSSRYLKKRKRIKNIAIFDYLKKSQRIANFNYLKNFKEPLSYICLPKI